MTSFESNNKKVKSNVKMLDYFVPVKLVLLFYST